MMLRRALSVIASTVLAAAGLVSAGAGAAGAEPVAPSVNLSRPLIRVQGAAARPASANGVPVTYSGNWSGYVDVPKRTGQTFTSITGTYTVPSVHCASSPNTFSYHWIGLDGWNDGTVEQDGVAADCDGTKPYYFAWYEVYPKNVQAVVVVHPGDAIESTVTYLGAQQYELALKDVTTGHGFDVTKHCGVTKCHNTSAETITEAYYYNKRYSGTSDFGDEHYGDVSVTDSGGNYGGLEDQAWTVNETIALGRYGDVDTTPGPLATVTSGGFSTSSAFTVFWSRKD